MSRSSSKADGARRRHLLPVGHSVNPEALARHLFPDPAARFFIGKDLNYRNGVALAARQLADVPAGRREPALVNWAWDHTFVLLQPDGFARRIVPDIIDIIRENGFEPVASQVVTPHKSTVGELWRYQANGTEPVYRESVIYPYMTTYPSLALILRDTSDEGKQGLPAAVRFMEAKGRTVVDKDDKSSIRARLGVTNTMFCLLHSCDGPGELLRESYLMGDLLNPDAFAFPASNIDDQLRSQITQINNLTPKHALQFAPALERITQAVEAIETPGYGGELAVTKDGLLATLDVIGRQHDLPTRSDATTRLELWEYFGALADYATTLGGKPDFETFDLLTVGADLVDYFRPPNEPHVVEPWRGDEWSVIDRPLELA